MLAVQFRTTGTRTMLAALFRTTGTRTMLAGECPLCGAERLEDGAPAPRDRLLRKGLVLLVLAHTKRLSEIPESLFCVYKQFVYAARGGYS